MHPSIQRKSFVDPLLKGTKWWSIFFWLESFLKVLLPTFSLCLIATIALFGFFDYNVTVGGPEAPPGAAPLLKDTRSIPAKSPLLLVSTTARLCSTERS